MLRGFCFSNLIHQKICNIIVISKVREVCGMEMVNLTKRMEEAYNRWEAYFNNGSTNGFFCPSFTDGYYCNSARSEILYYKTKICEYIKEHPGTEYPKIYYRETPEEMEREYIANAEEILKRAKEALIQFKANIDYKYIVQYKDDKNINQKEKSLKYVLGYVSRLEVSVNEKDYLHMRLYWNYERYFDSFKNMREKIEKLNGTYAGEQISLFSFI